MYNVFKQSEVPAVIAPAMFKDGFSTIEAAIEYLTGYAELMGYSIYLERDDENDAADAALFKGAVCDLYSIERGK